MFFELVGHLRQRMAGEVKAEDFLLGSQALRVRPSGSFGMTGNLVQWFGYSIVVSLIAGYIAGVAFGPGAEYLRVFQVAGCVAFAGYSLAIAQTSIWGGKSWATTFRNMADGLLYGLLTGGTFGWLWP